MTLSAGARLGPYDPPSLLAGATKRFGEVGRLRRTSDPEEVA
ncbi:MAG: hypothetical protein ACRD1P_09930 [Thermoanaerobaculia bacterium]